MQLALQPVVAVFGLGPAELVILVGGGLCCVGVLGAIVGTVIYLVSKSRDDRGRRE